METLLRSLTGCGPSEHHDFVGFSVVFRPIAEIALGTAGDRWGQSGVLGIAGDRWGPLRARVTTV